MNHPYLYPDEAPWTADYAELRAIRCAQCGYHNEPTGNPEMFTIILQADHGWTDIIGDEAVNEWPTAEAAAEAMEDIIASDHTFAGKRWKIVQVADLANYELVA